MEVFIEIIESVGFPIAACAALFWHMVQTDKQHKEEMDKIREALENNTAALIRLSSKLGGDDDGEAR